LAICRPTCSAAASRSALKRPPGDRDVHRRLIGYHMTAAIGVVSVERGHDPRDFVLVRSVAPARCMAARWLASSGSKPFWCRPFWGWT
jgi:hypothetical protein